MPHVCKLANVISQEQVLPRAMLAEKALFFGAVLAVGLSKFGQKSIVGPTLCRIQQHWHA
jgi:hypothetical protein